MKELELPFFNRMDPAARTNLSQSFEQRKLAPAETLCAEGEKGDAMFLILSGEVEIVRGSGTVDQMAAGQIVGELALVDSRPRNATVRAKTPVTALVITREGIERLKRNNPAAVFALYEAVLSQIGARFRAQLDRKAVDSFWLS